MINRTHQYDSISCRTGEIRGLARQLTSANGGSLRHTFSKAIKGFSATVSAQGAAVIAANAMAGDCANMSLGGLGHQESIHDAVVGAAELGIRFSLTAGNEASDAEGYEPAHIEHRNVYTISAIDDDDVFASFSNWGEPVDFAAPGVTITSTAMGGGTTVMSGTSMAAPHVCGILLQMAPPNMDGYAIDDPDDYPDPIAHF